VERPGVRRIARRFAREERDGGKWGKGEKKEDPTRAKVLGLRRFWEGIGKESRGV